MVGPAARGSLNGIPSSTMSAPAASAACSAATQRARSGNPAVKNGINAARPAAWTVFQRSAIGRSGKVVADLEAVLLRARDLDDAAREVAAGLLIGEIGQEPRILNRPVGGRH